MEKTIEGWVCGAVAVLIFSGSMPATREALSGFSPVFLTAARAALAGSVAFCLLISFRQAKPSARDFVSLFIVAAGAVLGFPLLSALALQHINSAQSQVFMAILPLVTAIFGVIRGGERPRGGFWVFAVLGSFALMAVTLSHGGGMPRDGIGLMLAGIIVCAMGYAEGARLSRRLGGWQVICLALVLAMPVSLLLCWLSQPKDFVQISVGAWLGLGYVSFFSMLVGFIFWYRGLALGGITTVGQIQLLQPGLGLIASAVVLNEVVPDATIWTVLGVVVCVGGARRFS